MPDITVRIDASGENLARVTAELLELLNNAARVDARPVPATAPDGSKGDGLSAGELAVAGALSANAVRALASVLVDWAKGQRRLTVAAAGEPMIIDATTGTETVVAWLRERG